MKRLFTCIVLSSVIFNAQMTLAADNETRPTLEARAEMLAEKISHAAKQQALWRDTNSLLTQAREQLALNNIAVAHSLLAQVEYQLMQAEQQAQQQSDISLLVPAYLTP